MVGRNALIAIILLLLSASTLAAPIASVDRNEVGRGETFTFSLILQDKLIASPDFDSFSRALDPALRILQGPSSSKSIRTVNGSTQYTSKWTMVLLAKKEGTYFLPPVKIGTEASEPLTITITDAPQKTQGSSDPVSVIANRRLWRC